jgi:hypothetical protein
MIPAEAGPDCRGAGTDTMGRLSTASPSRPPKGGERASDRGEERGGRKPHVVFNPVGSLVAVQVVTPVPVDDGAATAQFPGIRQSQLEKPALVRLSLIVIAIPPRLE